ncbi:integrator complex subunit 6 [Amia ocellicauda]|uniref:integrator complex subunit 6 n=1 Tax=Amia ocellicauda TaxID=2972642 RepID=UPI00346477A9
MPVLLFLIDTSASMNQRTHLGTTYLDIAKGAVETFMKLRSRDPASRGDRYMLVSFEEAPYGIKAGWKENHATFMTELKNLQAVGLTTVGYSLRTAFDLLNLNRLVTGIDNYGQGRNPFFLEPSVIVTITDGNKLTSTTGVQEELHLPLNTPLPGSELTKEPFRWDQRLFALVLRIPGHVAVEPEPVAGVPQDESAITPMCEVTGGRSYSVCSQRMLNQCLESLVQKIHSGVVINFEKTGPDPPPVEDGPPEALKPGPQPWHSCHKLIYVRPNPKTGVPIGHWPIPEAFWPDQNSPTLPPRTAHPQVRFSCVDSEPMVIDKLPFDKYELEPSPLTQYILERKSPHICWQVFVCNSAKYSDLGQPFGYLKASTALSCVNLFVMPYNFPVLLPLLDDLFKVHKLKPILKWQQSFENYLKTMPPYYIGPLKKALRMMGAPNLIADNMEYGLSYSVVSYLKKLSQQTKLESERVILSVGKKAPQDCGVKVRSRGNTLSLAQRRDFTQILQGITGEAPLCPLELNPKQFTGFHISVLNKDFKPQSFRNPYDIPRRHLLDQLTRMRRNLLKAARCWLRGQDEDQLHSIPIAQMGNYQDFLKHSPSPLREADPDQPKRLHTFGNPFKLDKKGMMIDEADEFVTGPQNRTKRPGDPSLQGAPKRRRCMSPLLRPGRLPAPSVVSNNVGAKAPPSPPSPAPPLPLPPPPPPPISLAKAMPVILKAPETNHRVLTDNDVFGNHMGNQYIPERAPVPDAGLNSDGSPFQSKAAPVNHVGDVEDGHSSPSELSEGSEEGEPSTEDTMSSSSPSQLKRLRQSQSQELNTQLRVLITREIRKPGRRYERIFYFLKQVQGSFNTRLIFLQNVIKEASRFKKRVLIEQLEGFLEEIHMRSNQMNHMDGFSNSA